MFRSFKTEHNILCYYESINAFLSLLTIVSRVIKVKSEGSKLFLSERDVVKPKSSLYVKEPYILLKDNSAFEKTVVLKR